MFCGRSSCKHDTAFKLNSQLFWKKTSCDKILNKNCNMKIFYLSRITEQCTSVWETVKASLQRKKSKPEPKARKKSCLFWNSATFGKRRGLQRKWIWFQNNAWLRKRKNFTQFYSKVRLMVLTTRLTTPIYQRLTVNPLSTTCLLHRLTKYKLRLELRT